MEQPISLFLDIIIGIIDIYIIYILYNVMFKKKQFNNYIFLFAFLSDAILSLIIQKTLYFNQPMILFFNFCLFFLLTFLFEGKFIFRLIIISIFYALGTISEIISYFTFNLINSFNYNIKTEDELFYIFMAFISRIILFSFIKIMSLIFKQRKNKIKIRYYIAILLIPIFCVFILHFIISFDIGNNENISNFLLIPIIAILIIVFCVIYLFENIYDKFELENKAFYLNRELKSQQINYEKNTSFFKNIAKLVHDINNHLKYIEACIEKNKNQEALNYLKKLNNNINTSITIVNTGNLLFDSLLSNIIGIAKENNIKIDYEIKLLNKKITIDVYDLCIILGNTFDNALEACKAIKSMYDKFIQIKIISDESNLIIKIKNSIDKKENLNKGKFLTTKNNDIEHGIGLKNIETTVSKYNGEMYIELEENQFYIAILLPI